MVTWSYRAADGKRRQRSPAHRLPLTRSAPPPSHHCRGDDGATDILPLDATPDPRLSPPPPPLRTPLDGILLVFSTMEDLTELRRPCTLAPRSRPAPRRRRRARRSRSQVVLRHELAVAGAAPPEVGSMHVIVLSDDKQPAIKSPSMSRVIRQSVADNRADEAQTVKSYGRVLAAKAATLRSNGVRRVSVLLPKSSATEATGADNMNYLSIFNFNGASGYDEEKMLRHILPPTANWLELHRLSNFHVERCWFPDTSLTHVYHATAVSQKLDTRLFVRTVVLRPPRSMSELAGLEAFEAIAKTELAASFDILEQVCPTHHSPLHSSLTTHPILEQAIGDSRYSKSESNHVFFRVLPKVCVSIAVAAMVPPLLPLIKKFLELELAIPLLVDPFDKEKVKAVRVIACSPSLKIKVAGEVANDVEPGTAPTHMRRQRHRRGRVAAVDHRPPSRDAHTDRHDEWRGPQAAVVPLSSPTSGSSAPSC